MKKNEITYNEAIEKIEAIIDSLSDRNMDIDMLAKEVKQASELIGICKDKLRDAGKEIDKIYNGKQEEK